jgi:hypothetical protein
VLELFTRSLYASYKLNSKRVDERLLRGCIRKDEIRGPLNNESVQINQLSIERVCINIKLICDVRGNLRQGIDYRIRIYLDGALRTSSSTDESLLPRKLLFNQPMQMLGNR